MRLFSFCKPEHMLRSSAEPMHFRSSGGAGLHNVTGQVCAAGHAARDVHVHGGASEHALTAGGVRVHRSGGWPERLLSNCSGGHHSVSCSVRLARATSPFIQQPYMQNPLSNVLANTISTLARVNLLRVSVPDVWKEGAEHSCIGARVWSRRFRTRFFIGGTQDISR